MDDPSKTGPDPVVLKIWQAAESLYGSNAERPLQIVIGNASPDGEPFFLIGLLPGRSVPAFVPMESRIPLAVGEEDSPLSLESGLDRMGRVTIIRGDIQEAEFGDFGDFLKELGVPLA
jgi:hypothetical protein